MTKVHEILMVAKQMKTKRRISRDLLYNSLHGIVRGIAVFPDLTIVLWVIFSQVTLVQKQSTYNQIQFIIFCIRYIMLFVC